MTDEALKLQRFKEAVSADITAQADMMIAEAQAECDRIMAAARADAARNGEAERDRIRAEAETELTRSISAARLDAQRSVLIRRGELADGVFERVKAKLAQLRQSDGYVKWLTAAVESCQKLYPEGKAVVSLAPEDMKHAPKLGCPVTEDSSIRLGGAIVGFEGSSTVCDCTFDSMLEAERADFCRNKEFGRE